MDEAAERREMTADELADAHDEIAVLRGIVARFTTGWRPSKYRAEWYRTSRTGPSRTEPMTLHEAREMGKA